MNGSIKVLKMASREFPGFTPQAARIWSAIPAEDRNYLLSKVWCVQCRHAVTITNFTGVIKGGDLLLVGKCAECQGDVARVIEKS